MLRILIRFIACMALFFAVSTGAGETTSIRIVVTGDTLGQVFPCRK
jgi:hypothetical protein